MPTASTHPKLRPALVPWLLGIALMGCIAFIFLQTPRELQMGEVYKIFYFHVASAMSCLSLFFFCAIASIAFLVLRNRSGWKRLATTCDHAAYGMAEIGVLYGAIVLTTGPIWAKPAWGTYWNWEPRLTLLLLTFFLFVGYIVLRAYGQRDEKVRNMASGIAVVGIPAALLTHFAIQLWKGGNHPQVITGEGGGLAHPAMRQAFGMTVAVVALLAIYLVWMRIKTHRLRDQTESLFLDLSDLEDARR